MSDLFASECSGESRHHRHPAHPPPVDINQRPTILHVNVCTKDRERSLDNANAMAALKASWVKSTQWIVGYFMIMPDHIHLLVCPRPNGDLIGFVRRVKSKSTRTYWTLGGTAKLWQRGFYDHVLRQSEDVNDVAAYILENPVRAGLVSDFTRYPFSGPPELLQS